MYRKTRIIRCGLMFGGAALAAGTVILSGVALAADLPSEPAVYAQLQLPGGIGGILGHIRDKKPPHEKRTDGSGVSSSNNGGGSHAGRNPAYDKLVDAASAVAADVFKHEHPDNDAPSYAGPADPYTDHVWSNDVLKKINECQDAAAAALAAGIPGTTPISYSTQGSSLISPTPLQDMSAKVCGKYKALAEGNTAEGKMKPFLAALSGGKKTTYAGIIDVTLHAFKGPGGRNLTRPVDFATSPRWCSFGHVADAYPARWYIHCWIFNGNTLVRQIDKEGWGYDPPSSAF